MSDRIDVINYFRTLFAETLPETHYIRNKKKTVVYPYQTFTFTGEPTHFNGQGFYIDVDIFNNDGNSEVAIEKALSAMIERFNTADGFHQLTDKFLVQIEYRSDNPVPTGSNTLQRRYLQLYARVDWRK